jgi:hypothetical protein
MSVTLLDKYLDMQSVHRGYPSGKRISVGKTVDDDHADGRGIDLDTGCIL